MTDKKPWTVMVYLAADNNLTNFGIDSLRQMKAAAKNTINVIAEFDSGPRNASKRYVFDGEKPFGRLNSRPSLRDTFGPSDAADPDNLAAFVDWGTSNFPAEHYFVIIWGHGGGVDDAFPRAPDNSFIPRHNLLSLFKGVLDEPLKGVLDEPLKGVLDEPLKTIFTALEDGHDGVHQAVVKALDKGIRHVLNESTVNRILSQKMSDLPAPPLSPVEVENLRHLSTQIVDLLRPRVISTLANGQLASVRQGILTALRNGILDATQTGVICDLLTQALSTIQKSDATSLAAHVADAIATGILSFLQNGILEALKMGVFNLPAQDRKATKSLAFVDHPEDFLTNAGLQEALYKVIGKVRKIDLLGMDACNMNMIEIGYELRNSVGIMVASQDDIPDASWPYDQILNRLANSPDMSPSQLVSATTETYANYYADYVDEPVTLSGLELEKSVGLVPFISGLADALHQASGSLRGQLAIDSARRQVRSFGQDEFVDLIHFCEILTSATAAPQLAKTASNLIAPLRSFISSNASNNEANCNGTSIYFPQYNQPRAQHIEQLFPLYNQLDFARDTRWGQFVAYFFQRQKRQAAIAQALNSTGRQPKKQAAIVQAQNSTDQQPKKQAAIAQAQNSTARQSVHGQSAPGLVKAQGKKTTRKSPGTLVNGKDKHSDRPHV